VIRRDELPLRQATQMRVSDGVLRVACGVRKRTLSVSRLAFGVKEGTSLEIYHGVRGERWYKYGVLMDSKSIGHYGRRSDGEGDFTPLTLRLEFDFIVWVQVAFYLWIVCICGVVRWIPRVFLFGGFPV